VSQSRGATINEKQASGMVLLISQVCVHVCLCSIMHHCSLFKCPF